MTTSAALKALGVPVTQAMLDAALSAAERESLSHLEFLHRLLAGPAEARKQRAVDRRIRAAKFRELTSLEGFDWAFNAKGIDRRTIEQLATCDFGAAARTSCWSAKAGWARAVSCKRLGWLPVRWATTSVMQLAPGCFRNSRRRWPTVRCSDAGRLRAPGPLADRRVRF